MLSLYDSHFLSFDTCKTTFFVSDMWQTYRDLVKDIFPHTAFFKWLFPVTCRVLSLVPKQYLLGKKASLIFLKYLIRTVIQKALTIRLKYLKETFLAIAIKRLITTN
jgi:hypothetical protein